MQTATSEEIQARLPELLERMLAREEFVIVRDGQPVGRLSPAAAKKAQPKFGSGKGTRLFYAQDDEHLMDIAESMA